MLTADQGRWVKKHIYTRRLENLEMTFVFLSGSTLKLHDILNTRNWGKSDLWNIKQRTYLLTRQLLD